MDYLNIASQPVVLASKSPRRYDLLRKIINNLIVIPSFFDESSIKISTPEKYVKKLSLCKAKSVAKTYPDKWVIGADTIVVIENEIIGKPNNKSQAVAMLKNLSEKKHIVYTGYTILCECVKKVFTKVVSTKVQFKKLSIEEVEHYVSTGEPFDKSGGYAIQGIGSFMVRAINGSYTNVMGLPMCEVTEDLIKMGVINLRI